MASTYPQFDYWYTVLQLELLFIQLLGSQCEQKLCGGAWKNSSMDVCTLPLLLMDDCSCQRPTTFREYQP